LTSATNGAGRLSRTKNLFHSGESDHLNALFASPAYRVRFKWQTGSLAFWDNRSMQHYGVWDFGDETRELERVTIKGEPIA
jgi:taurine dioxygenase